MTINYLPETISEIGKDIRGIKHNINTTILDFSNGVPINDGTLHKLSDYYDALEDAESAFTGVPIAYAGVKLGGWENVSVAWCAAWMASISDVDNVYIPNGRYIFNAPLILRKEGQKWYSDGESRQIFKHHHVNTAFEFIGDASSFRTVLTRRNYRDSSDDSHDDPLVACIQIENNGIKFNVPVVIEHNVSWASTHPNNMIGGDPVWDVGVFVGCRVEVDLRECVVLGHHKFANVYIDVTRSALLSELKGWDNVYNPASVQSGADGLCMDYCSLSGGRWRYVILGAKFKSGYSSYGSDYLKYLTITFSGNPTQGDTLTLGEQVFVFGNTADFGEYTIAIGNTLTETLDNLMMVLYGASEVQDTSKPLFNSAAYLLDGNVITCVDNTESTSNFSNFTANKSSSVITLSGNTVTITTTDPAPYYDDVYGLVTDNRGGYGASDVTGYRMFTTESEYLTGRRVWEDIRTDKNHTLEGISAGAMWIDSPAANSYKRIWGQRYISCRFASYDPFIVRLGKCARITFIDCHTEPAERVIKKLDGTTTTDRYGSYTSTKESLAINIEGANASPSSAYFNIYGRGSNVFRPLSGINRLGGSLNIKGSITSGTGSIYEDPATLKLNGGQYQDIYFGDSSQAKKGRINYSGVVMGFRTGGSTGVNAYQTMRLEYLPAFNQSLWDTPYNLKVESSTGSTTIDSVTETNLVSDVSVKTKIGAATITEAQATYFRINQPIRPDTSNSTVATVGTSGSRFGKGWINDLRMIPPSSVTLTGNGELAFEAVSDTQVRLKLRGSDGITRSVTLTLA
ncbi:hypothetical protein EKK58_09785 [Candidatus Dependentiae bacterium]|nr:MAG: hypothetical protein EKK58_09785 [Candidatus Dependentiae bacterium]